MPCKSRTLRLSSTRSRRKKGRTSRIDLEFTHAWLPKDQFDEVVEAGHWIFARKGDGYLAFWTLGDYHWQDDEGEDQNRELIVPGKENTFICELGRKEKDGGFEAFRKRIEDAVLLADEDDVVYHSPSQGVLEFGWRGPLRQNGQKVAIGDHPRYDSPYAQVPYNATRMEFECNGHWLKLDWDNCTREASEYMQPQ